MDRIYECACESGGVSEAPVSTERLAQDLRLPGRELALGRLPAWLDVRDVLRKFPERSKGRFTI